MLLFFFQKVTIWNVNGVSTALLVGSTVFILKSLSMLVRMNTFNASTQQNAQYFIEWKVRQQNIFSELMFVFKRRRLYCFCSTTFVKCFVNVCHSMNHQKVNTLQRLSITSITDHYHNILLTPLRNQVYPPKRVSFFFFLFPFCF